MLHEFILAWTQQLYREYDHICWYYRLKLRQPLIRIHEMGQKYGQWDPASREISIGVALIQNYPWNVVLEVFKHEIAHQVANELYFSDSHLHDDDFDRACTLLSVESWARRATGDLPEDVEHRGVRVLTDAEERLLRKTEKLLNLSSSSNEHEAKLAVQLVRELYQKYHMEHFANSKKLKFESKTLHLGKKRIPRVQSAILSLLNEHYSVRVVYSDLYDPKKLQKFKVVDLSGTHENIVMAEYVYAFLNRKLDELWMDFPSKTRSHMEKKSYFLGVIRGFDRQLHQSRQPEYTIPASRALILRMDHDLEKYMQEKFPRLHGRSASRASVDSGAYTRGMQDGQSLKISRPIEKRGGFGGFLRG